MENHVRTLARLGLGVILICPVFAILFFAHSWSWPDTAALLSVLQSTLSQSIVSAAISLVLGTIGALGLLSFAGQPRYRWFELACLLPGFLPPLLVILPVFRWGSWVGHYPFGWHGIVLVHSLMCIGLVAVAVARLIQSKLGGMIELAWVEGASRWSLIRQGLLGYLRADFLLLGFYLVTLCFSSFAVPLVMGGAQSLTIEVLIYEKIRQGGAWSEAFVLSIIQLVFLFAFSLVLRRGIVVPPRGRSQVRFLSSRLGITVPLAITFLVVVGQVAGLVTGLAQLMAARELLLALPRLIANTMLVGLGAGVVAFLLMNLVAALSPHWGLDRFLVGYSSPSPVITAFAFLLFGFYGYWGSHGAMILGLSLLSLPSLYRLFGRAAILSLGRQVQVARVAGASWSLIFRVIIFPQVRSHFLWLAGLAGFWASGDFALSSIVAESNSTLGLMAKAYMSSYQLELATALSWILLLVSGIIFAVFGGWAHVSHQESYS